MQVETQSRNGRVEQVEPLTAWASPQPIGIFSLPTGYLVLPAPQQNASAALKALLNGHIETEMPPEWQFFKASAHGHTQTALNLLTGNDPISRYNRFVLQSDPAEYAQLAASLPAPLAQLLAVVGYTLGYADQLPAPDGLKNEWAAMVWLTHATHALEIDEPSRAVEALDKAIATARPVSPILCAQALSQLAQVRRNMPGHIAGLIMQYYREAIRQAGDTPLPHFRAG
ncbi:MAG: hypothetical protein KIH69_000580, partial [Anaerolineae bacterium]|nr:hypothetical protein [Anaerolineae bacterium]